MTDQLAVLGGPKAVRGLRFDRWRKIGLREIVEIAGYALLDINTVATGKGPIRRLENGFKKLCGTRYALAMNSGTATLFSAYFAVGVCPGDEVIVPSYTWFASATPLMLLGARPVFCEVDERTLTADPEDVERRITSRTRAICVVHLWGNPARMDRLAEIARRHGIALIEDCSHAHGASYADEPVGSWGDVGCFSLQGEKAVSGGEAGIAVTDEPALFDRMLALAHNGRTKNGQVSGTFEVGNASLGMKFRPHLYAAVLACGSLRRLSRLNRLRARNYQILSESLENCAAVRPIETYPDAVRGGFLSFAFRYDPAAAGGWSRDAFVRAARAEGVPISVGRYTRLDDDWRVVHEAPFFYSLDPEQVGGAMRAMAAATGKEGTRPELPVTERLAEQLLSMPPLTRVSRRFLRSCGEALQKVAENAGAVRDLREVRAA